MKFSTLAAYNHDGDVRLIHIADATGDVDQEALLDRTMEIAKAQYGHPSALMCINTSDMKGYTATMAKVTHDMWGQAV